MHYSHKSGGRLSQLKVCGERNSGTCFLKVLMERNFPELNVHHVCSRKFGYKHFLWWFDTHLDRRKLQRLQYSPEAATLANSNNCLFIVIIRNPYDWLRSFYLMPHHVSPKMKEKGFFHFISAEWHLKDDFEAIDGYNPYTKRPFSNLLELRGYKIKNYLRLGDLVRNYCFVRYEDLANDPEGFVNFVADFYRLKKPSKFIPVDTHRGYAKKPYKKKKYFELDEKTMDFINQSLDWGAESRVGYFAQDTVD